MAMFRGQTHTHACRILFVSALVLALSPSWTAEAGSRARRGAKGKAAVSRAQVRGAGVKDKSKSASAIAASKAVVFDFKGEEVEPVRSKVVKILRAQGMEVLTHLRAPDTPQQFREMSVALGLAVYVHGQIKEMGGNQATALVSVRSGSSGRVVTSLRFSGGRAKVVADLEEEFWPKVERAVASACLAADKPGRRFKPMRIDAGTPIEDSKAQDRTGS